MAKFKKLIGQPVEQSPALTNPALANAARFSQFSALSPAGSFASPYGGMVPNPGAPYGPDAPQKPIPYGDDTPHQAEPPLGSRPATPAPTPTFEQAPPLGLPPASQPKPPGVFRMLEVGPGANVRTSGNFSALINNSTTPSTPDAVKYRLITA